VETVLAVSAAAVQVSVILRDSRQDSAEYRGLISKASEHAASGRRLAIYERDTGLFAHWYMTLRVSEECARAARYGHNVTLALLEPAPDSVAFQVQAELAVWLRANLRSSDLASYLGYARYVVVTPDTNQTQALSMLTRVLEGVPGLLGSLSCFPSDGETFEQLHRAAAARLRDVPETKAA
jgi:GGDEF domain-containing protein